MSSSSDATPVSTASVPADQLRAHVGQQPRRAAMPSSGGRPGRATMRDIAQQLGVTITTVSRALNDKPDVSPETRQRVQEAASRLSYVRSALGSGLANGYVDAIGCVVTSISDPYIAGILDGIEDVAQRSGYALIIATSHADARRELSVVQTFQAYRVAGVISTSSHMYATQLAQLQGLSSPLVLINHEGSGPETASVRIDDGAIANTATRHLIDLGHRRIAHIMCDDGSASSMARVDGFRRTLIEAGLPLDPQAIIAAEDSEAGGAGAVEQLLRLQPRPTAVFCYNDRIAIGVLAGLRRASLIVPDDLSVVGVDDISVASWVTPALTTVRQPAREMGQLAMETTLKILAGATTSSTVLPGVLVERESTAPPPAEPLSPQEASGQPPVSHPLASQPPASQPPSP